MIKPRVGKTGFTFDHLADAGDIHAMQSVSAKKWDQAGKKMAIRMANYAVKHVPAYKKLLRAQHKNASVRAIENFAELPVVDKDNYLRANSYEDLFSRAERMNATTVSATSGSTGEPFYFPRGEAQDKQYEYMMEALITQQFDLPKKRTLAIVGFGLGIWIGGIFTYKVFNALGQKGYPVTLIPIGPNVPHYLHAFKKFAGTYDQIILMGYPPFIRDMLDAGIAQGIKWKDYNLRVLTAAEGYSEDYRNYVGDLAGIKDKANSIVNMYGTVELGTMACETTLTSTIRALAHQHKNIFSDLFPGATGLPTLVQYYPQYVYFEEVKGEVIGTGLGASIPLVRYRFHDLGGVIPYERMAEVLQAHGIHIEKLVKGGSGGSMKLPFVYTYAREDQTMVFHGANIYPSEIREVLDRKVYQKYITGRFTLEKKENRFAKTQLFIHVEARAGNMPPSSFAKSLFNDLHQHLMKTNSEYNNMYTYEKVLPKIKLWKHGTKKFFSRQGKQNWVEKKKK